MKKDVHAAALHAAAKVAFSVAFIMGCSSSSETADDENGPAQESDVKSSNNACGDKKFSCEDLVKAAFPTPGHYPGATVTTSNAVQGCCTELLKSPAHTTMANRWDCCANHGTSDIGMACTPWGPPVPPSMKRRTLNTADTIA